MLNNNIWNKINNKLKAKLNNAEFQTWFSHLTLKKMNPDSVIIGVPNKFVASWIKDNYIQEIKKTISELSKTNPEIHFSFDQTFDENSHTQNSSSKLSKNFQKRYLNPLMTFDSFVTGNCNRFAYSSAFEIASRSKAQYNPLYIYSKHSLGKTHLLNAIGNHFIDRDPSIIAKYISADMFTRDVTSSFKNNNKIKEEYNNLSILLFDDIQKLYTRKRMQEEFLGIFDAFYEEKKPIIITSNRPPNKLKYINPQLKSRLGWGLITEIQLPENRIKINIIKNKAEEDNIAISDDVVFFLANYNKDIKTLIKNIIRVETYASLNGGNLNLSTVKFIIKEKSKEDIGIEDIKTVTAGYFNISVTDIISPKKKKIFSYPRQLAMYLARKYTNLSFKEIGELFGPKDHSTVIYAIRRIDKSRNREKNIDNDLKNIEILLH